jgi:bifunctional enzyme CysN/CysC
MRGDSYRLRMQTRDVPVIVEAIEAIYDPDALAQHPADKVERNEIADVVLRSYAMLALDEADQNPRTGRFVLGDGANIVAGGTISMRGYADQRKPVTAKSTNITAVAHRVSNPQRIARNGHKGGVLWFTGLSGAGKSTIAMAVEQELFRRGYQTYVLDGDNVRRGLNSNLDFSPADRAENIRRVGEVAALFADSGLIVVTAFISPYRADRYRARTAAGDGFHEIYINASLETCEKRDPKGLYRKARSGEIADFTGVTAPYETPESPELTIDTDRLAIEESVAAVLEYVDQNFRKTV